MSVFCNNPIKIRTYLNNAEHNLNRFLIISMRYHLEWTSYVRMLLVCFGIPNK